MLAAAGGGARALDAALGGTLDVLLGRAFGDLGRVAAEVEAEAEAAAAPLLLGEERAVNESLGIAREGSERCANCSITTCSVPLISARQNGHKWFAPSPLSSHCVRHVEHSRWPHGSIFTSCTAESR